MRRKYRTRRYARVAPPDNVYLISPAQAAAALGVSKASLARWRQEWKEQGTSAGPEPIWLTPRIVKYRAAECFNFPDGMTFVERMRTTTAATSTPTATAVAGAN